MRKLKEIMDLIGYNKHYWREIYLWNDWYLYCRGEWYMIDIIDISTEEIIFSPWFWKALKKYYRKNNLLPLSPWKYMEDNLDNPVKYLYNTLWIWTYEDK